LAKRITKNLLAARAAFKQRVSEFLKAVGADQIDGMYDWRLHTHYGDLDISVWDNAVMCRFDDVAKGTALTRQFTFQSCNPHSGKWNWHYPDDADTLNGDCEAQFVQNVTLLMSLGTLPADLTTLTPVQAEQCLAHLSPLPLAELSRRQDLTNRQIDLAVKQRNDVALANLHVRVEHLRLAVDRQAFGGQK